jgi:hypothetical protein
MAFLDNSGDIILDAVLTDTGRLRLARGDGSFRIAKFALGDDEINYATFDASSATAPDLDMARTPVLEAFTNNVSSMHSRLQTYTSNDHLYLPVMKLNDAVARGQLNTTIGAFLVTSDSNTTAAALPSATAGTLPGVIVGDGSTTRKKRVIIDQGIDNGAIDILDSQMYENQYLIEIDNRLGTIVDWEQTSQLDASFIDDDQVASYYVSKTVNSEFVKNNSTAVSTTNSQADQVIAGARGSTLEFAIRVSANLQASTSLFTRLGSTVLANEMGGSDTTPFYFIDSTIRVTGLTTGYRLDVPVRFIKLQ